MKLTEWYPAEVKPVREGVYEVPAGNVIGAGTYYSWFQSGLWGAVAGTIECAAQARWYSSHFQERSWRGVFK